MKLPWENAFEITNAALEKIQAHSKTHPNSILKLSLQKDAFGYFRPQVYWKEKDLEFSKEELVLEDSVQITKEFAKLLKDFVLEFDQKTNSFWIARKSFELTSLPTANPQIRRFTIRKADFPSLAIAETEFQENPKKFPKWIQNLFAIEKIASVFTQKKILQVETKSSEFSKELEDKIISVVEEHFSLPYSEK